jgi:DNA polymerase IV (archaeal DinB-like DNA polymerase)
MDTGRVILHVDMDAFFASCERVRRPEMAGRPLVVGADPRAGYSRGVVTAASYEARKFGIRAGMPISQAYRLRRDAVFLPTDHGHYREVSRRIFHSLASRHRIEQVSVDEAYIELPSGTDWDEVQTHAQEIRDLVGQATGGLTCSIGAAPNRLVAKIASDLRKPAGFTSVPPPAIQDVLDPLPVGRVPGIGPKTAAALEAMGFVRLRDLRSAPRGVLEEAFGAHGTWMRRASQGLDSTPLRTQWEPHKSLGTERTLRHDTRDRQRLVAALRRMIDEIEQDLLSHGYWYRSLAVKLRYADFATVTRHTSVPTPTQDTTTVRRQILRILDDLLRDGRAVRLVGLRATDLHHNHGQAPIEAFLPSATACA